MKFLFTLAILVSLDSLAADKPTGTLAINSDQSQALLVMAEYEPGKLAELYEQMKLPAKENVKAIKLSNARFGLRCAKESSVATSCIFSIRMGDDSGDINTSIHTVGKDKAAIVGMTQVFGKELQGVFPSESNGAVKYVLNFPPVTLEVRGSTSGHMVIGLSEKHER